MDDRIPMTQTGYNKIRAELEHLETVVLSEVTQRIAQAREEGDLSENAEYHGARETQGMVMAKIQFLRDKLSRAYVIDPARVPRDVVALGATITLRDLDTGEEETFTLVGAGEEDLDANRILITSPFSKGFIGKKKGDIVEVTVPRGTQRYQILDLRYEDLDDGDAQSPSEA